MRAAAVLVLALLTLLIAEAGASADPRLTIRTMANSSVAPGGQLQYLLTVTNNGDTDTDGSPYTLTVSLPATLGAVEASGFGWDCSSLVPGTQTFSCENAEVLAARNGATPTLTITVDVSSGAAGVVTAFFEVAGGGASPSDTADPTQVTDAAPEFGIAAFDVGAIRSTGDAFTQAGGHPFAFNTMIELTSHTHPTQGPTFPVEPFKHVVVDLPPGFVGNPSSVGQCTMAQLAAEFGNPECPPDSQVGIARIFFNNLPGGSPVAVYSLVPPPDTPARFGINVAGSVVVLDAQLRSGSDYGLSVVASNAPEIFAIRGLDVTFWGYPADAAHDFERSCPGEPSPVGSGLPGCAVQSDAEPFLRNPTSCPQPGTGLVTNLRADSWVDPDNFETASTVSHLPPGFPFPPEMWGPQQGPTGCALVPFDPVLEGTPATPAQANEPSGFTFELTIPQNDDEIGQSDLRRAAVTLPEGVRVSPSSAMGLAGCSSAQIALASVAKPTCPDASKVGTVTSETPLLEEPLTGAVYLATPFDNPSNSLVGLYLVMDGPGVIVKLHGRVDLDPETGQITTTFDDSPQLPFSSLTLRLKDGPRAPVVLPRRCGTYTTRAVLTGWSGKTVVSQSSFTVDRGADGGPCPSKREFSPEFSAGAMNPVAGAYSPFALNLARDDEDEEFDSLSVEMPQGVLARVKGVPQCPPAQAALGACDERSRVGTVTTGAGAGSHPFFLDGTAYWAGPYKGAPFSLVISVPAVAGPFDLGTVVVRSAVHIDRRTAQAQVVSDPFPRMLEGIPLQIRDVEVLIDRERFFLNPTSCKEKAIRARVASTDGSIAHVRSRFQVGDCASLRLRPRLALRVGAKGRTAEGVSTPLVTTLRQGHGQSGLRSVGVQLPLVLNGRIEVISDACTREEFEANAAKNCADARTGVAVARTPLLARPLKGSVYFVEKPGRGLPNLVVALRGEVDVDLVGTVRIPRSNTLGTVFRSIPDVPVSSFRLKLFAGKNGALGTTANLCSKRARRATARVRFVGHDGDRFAERHRLKIAGCPKRR
jgi:hypothetical protein